MSLEQLQALDAGRGRQFARDTLILVQSMAAIWSTRSDDFRDAQQRLIDAS